jgi:hypothetical protein
VDGTRYVGTRGQVGFNYSIKRKPADKKKETEMICFAELVEVAFAS